MKKIILLLLIFTTSNLNAAIIYVNKTASGLNDGTSWTNAYTDLEYALLFALSGDEVWVAKGTYYTSSSNDRSSSFVLNNGVKLYGNFYGNETSISQRVDLIPNSTGSNRTNETVLSGDIGTLNNITDNANHVIYIINTTLPIIIDGVKVIGGNAILTVGKGKGGGIYIDNAGDVTLQNIIVSGNYGSAGAEGKGGGVYVNLAAKFTMENSTIIQNQLIDDPLVTGTSNYYGGGVYINSPQNQIISSFIDNNTVLSSRATLYGGGIYSFNNINCSISNTTIRNNIIKSTSTSSIYAYGGGIAYYGNTYSEIKVVNSDFENNDIDIKKGYTYGAGGYIGLDSLIVSGSVFDDNTVTNVNTAISTNQGGGLYLVITKKTRITNTSFDNNSIFGRYASGGGLFLNATSPDTAIISNCSFSHNMLQSNNYYDGTLSGGGFYSSGKMSVINSEIRNNNVSIVSQATSAYSDATATAYGGGLAAFAYARLYNCKVDSNYLEASSDYTVENYMTFPDILSRAYGGGIYASGKLIVENSDVNKNEVIASISSYYSWSSYFIGYSYGGGVYNEFVTSGQKSLIRNCSIINNSTKTYLSYANGETKGGGVFGKNIDIFNNQISSNETYVDISVTGGLNQGGGVFHSGTGKIYNSTISNNKAAASTSYMSGGYSSNSYGGGIYSNTVDTIANCLIHNNRVIARNKAYGGGIYNRGASKMTNLTIAKNHTYSELNTRNGSGLFNKLATAQTLNSVIYFNDLLDYYDSTANALVKNSVIQLYQSGGGNFNINPQFVDTAANNFHVTPASIAINRGDNAYVPQSVHFDLDGNARISGSSVDIGVYELDQCRTYTTFNETICNGDFYFFNGQNITSSGTYKDTLINVALCDSIITLNLTVRPIITGVDVKSVCNSYTWIDGITYTSSNNTATHTLTNVQGCDSVVTLNLTIRHSNTGIDTKTACDSYTWINGVTYTSSNNTATHTLTNAQGCDSIVTLNLTIRHSNTGIDTKSVCNSYIWIDGITYTSSNNTATHTLTNAQGCDSVVTLNLTIRHSNTGIDTKTDCDSYTWINGVTYTSSNNTATHTLTNAQGCDSVVTLNLTIRHSNTGVDTKTDCDSYTWINGVTYTSNNNTATHTLTNAQGCDSVVTLNLTIRHSNTGIDTKTDCDSYTWINGVTYTSSNNTATHTLTNAQGCDSVVTLDLTIRHSNTGIDTKTDCDSYTWINGVTYTSSNNTATHTLTNAQGCDSVVTLNLTIRHSNTGIDTKAACNSYTWINGVTYTSSNNTETHTLINTLGCDSVVTLNLTINVINTTVNINEPTLSANATNVGYQWVDCNNSFAVIPFANGQNFSPSANGYYAVIIDDNGCTDTSSCYQIITVGIQKIDIESKVNIYPNPNNGKFFIELNNDSQISIIDELGRDIYNSIIRKGSEEIDLGNDVNGFYLIKITSNNQQSVFRMVINR